MDVYRAPFPDERSRIPTLRFPNELPIAGEPACVWKTLSDAHSALRVSNYRKRLFVGNTGALVSPDFARQFSATLKNCDVVEVGAGMHYLPESSEEHTAELQSRMSVSSAGFCMTKKNRKIRKHTKIQTHRHIIMEEGQD